jgi:predicted TIM-barrel fold metal-dependent hydrolase
MAYAGTSFIKDSFMFKSVLLFSYFSLTLLTFSSFAQSTPEAIELAKKVPIADVHMHTYEQNPRSAIWWREQMDANNVKWGGAVGDYRPDVQAELQERYIPTLGQVAYFKVFFKDGPSGLTDPENPIFKDLYQRADQLFKAGLVKGFGEFHTDNHSSGHPRIRRSIRTDNPAMRKFYAIADQYSGFVQIHSELDAAFERDILSLSSDFPNVTTVLAHCLSTRNAKSVGVLLGQRSNVVCEMSATGNVHNRLLGINRSAHAFDYFGLHKEWQNLMKSYPDQFMIGSDSCCGLGGSYADIIHELRTNLLPYLPIENLEKVAYKNAVRIFKLKD